MSEHSPAETADRDVQNEWNVDDPVVAEVRAIRDAMSAEAEHDVARLYEMFKAREEVERAAGREVITPPDRTSAPRGAAA